MTAEHLHLDDLPIAGRDHASHRLVILHLGAFLAAKGLHGEHIANAADRHKIDRVLHLHPHIFPDGGFVHGRNGYARISARIAQDLPQLIGRNARLGMNFDHPDKLGQGKKQCNEPDQTAEQHIPPPQAVEHKRRAMTA